MWFEAYRKSLADKPRARNVKHRPRDSSITPRDSISKKVGKSLRIPHSFAVGSADLMVL